MNATAARARTGHCAECRIEIEQKLVLDDPPVWSPNFCSEACDNVRISKQKAYVGRVNEATRAHELSNRLAAANLSGTAAGGKVTLDNVAEGYEGARRTAGVTAERYREIATAVRDFITVPPLLRVAGVASIVYLYGPEGTGKSFLAEVAAAHVIHTLGRSAIFTPLMDMLSHIRAAFEPQEPKTEARVLESYYGADLLVVDDVTRRLEPTKWEMETLLRVVDQRLRMRRPTIFTGNYDVPGLYKLWSNADDERVTQQVRLLCDRLADTKHAISLAMTGRSLRREKL